MPLKRALALRQGQDILFEKAGEVLFRTGGDSTIGGHTTGRPNPASGHEGTGDQLQAP